MSCLTNSVFPQRSLMILLVVSALQVVPSLAQRDASKADVEAGHAIEFMDANMPDNAIAAWDKALSFMPGYTPYIYEKCVSLVMAKRYQEALITLSPIHADTSLHDRGYQLMGNCYDFMQDTTNSRRYYREGVKQYPNSGRLHFEIGQQYYVEGNRAQANEWWRKGTIVEPKLATNYYWLARSYTETRDLIWTVFYGEAFLNIERNTARTRDISKLLFETWNRSLKLGDTVDPINFCSDELLDVPSPKGAQQMSFPVAFEYNIALAAQPFIPKDSVRTRVSIEMLVDLRYRFTRAWFQAGYDKKYKNDILEWNKTLLDNGQLKEYLWWLYGYGDKREMNRYFASSGDRYDTFLVWFGEHGMHFERPLCLGLGCP
ncbi:MAG: hypothetical protein NTX15_03295 [Candidatus Kapabacteria bacterium]|nr:hypothetical protein [Candidatus Kapabacteria bacterium]